jgi:hypothetical protein
MPVPVSTTRSSAEWSSRLVRINSRPPSGMASRALTARFIT